MPRLKILKIFCILSITISVTVLSVVSQADDRNASWLKGNASTFPDFTLLVAVHWEGEHISEASINALNNLRTTLKGVRFIHLLNAAYFSREKDPEIRKKIAKKIKSTITKNDYLGVHLNPYKSLVSLAKVDFNDSPTFWGNELDSNQCKVDCGHEISLAGYTDQEILSLIRKSKQILNAEGFTDLKFFHAGGWFNRPSLSNFLEDEGFQFSLNHLRTDYLSETLGGYPIFKVLQESSAKIPRDRSHSKKGELIQVHNYIGYTSYHSRKELIRYFKSFIKQSMEATPVWTLALSQETANSDSLILSQAIWDILSYSRKYELRSSFFELHPEATEGNQRLVKIEEGKSTEKNPEVDSTLQGDKKEGAFGKIARDFYSKMLQYSQ